MNIRTPTLQGVLNLVKENVFADLHVALPCRVERYDAALQVVDVKPLVRDSYEGLDGVETPVEFPVIPNVPLMFPGGGGFRVTFPVAVGDTVLVVFADRSIDKWQASGQLSDVTSEHRHHLTDAIAIPGLHSNTAPWSGAEPGCVTLGSDGGAAEFVATAQRVLTELQAVKAAFDAHTHPSPPAPANPVVTGPPLVPMPVPNAPASQTVKIKG